MAGESLTCGRISKQLPSAVHPLVVLSVPRFRKLFGWATRWIRFCGCDYGSIDNRQIIDNVPRHLRDADGIPNIFAETG